MLSATLYRIRRDLAKKPWVPILALIALAFAVMMIWTGSMASEDSDVVRNLELSIGAINVITILVFDFIFMSGLNSGAVGFSTADVNFHMAGPFTPKFNLILASGGIAKLCALFLWVLCCQSTTLSLMFGFNAKDLIALILGNMLTMCLGYAAGSFLCAFFNDNEDAVRKVKIGFYAVNVIFVAVSFALLYKSHGSIDAIKALGIKGIISGIGSATPAKFFPFAGWINLVYTGIAYKNSFYLIVGIVVTLALIATIVALYLKCDVDYYESAMASAQKLADLKEAKRAGVDTDTAKVNEKVKVGRETLTKGWGASVFTYRHFLENSRASKLFFINYLGILYRIISFGYGMMMDKVIGMDSPEATIVAVMVMMIMLNGVVYGGGKTILEFNRPYIFMIPEKASKKLMACLSASVPEILFDSVLCGAMVMYFGHMGIAVGICTAVMMVVFDFLFQLVGLLSLRIFKSLGRTLLIMLRTLLGYGLILVSFIPALIVFLVSGGVSIAVIFAVAAAVGAVITGILMIFAKDLIDKVEFV